MGNEKDCRHTPKNREQHRRENIAAKASITKPHKQNFVAETSNEYSRTTI